MTFTHSPTQHCLPGMVLADKRTEWQVQHRAGHQVPEAPRMPQWRKDTAGEWEPRVCALGPQALENQHTSQQRNRARRLLFREAALLPE